MYTWDYDKLRAMNDEDNPFIENRLDYVYIAENLEKIVQTSYSRGYPVPLEFMDVKTACSSDPFDEITLPEIADDLKENIEKLEHERQVMHIKHFSRSISHEAWFKFIDDEVNVFIREFPEFKDSLQ